MDKKSIILENNKDNKIDNKESKIYKNSVINRNGKGIDKIARDIGKNGVDGDKKALKLSTKLCLEYTNLSVRKRLLAGVFAITFLFLLVIIRMANLSIFSGEKLQIKAQEQWTRTLFLKANRGVIMDRNGLILAKNDTSYDVFLRAKEIEDPIRTSKYLSEKLNLDFEKTYMKAKDVFVSEVLVKLQVDEKTASEIVNENLQGVYITQNILRTYPYEDLLTQVLGFLTADSIGQSGVENYYNEVLRGVDGRYLTQSDVRGLTLDDSIKYYVEGVDGLSVKLNIDINIQRSVEDALAIAMEEQKPKRVSCIVMDPNNSNILAMAILPNFDLNNVPRDDVKTLMEIMKNTTVTDVYEPGSTFKILTLAAAVSEGLTNLDERFYCPGFRVVDGERIKCWRRTGHGSQTLAECVQNSCNCCFMDLALRLGTQKLYKYLRAFGIGSATGVDIRGESGGLLLEESLVKTVDLARIGFGQTVAVNELQLLNAFCSVINGGTVYRPSLLKSYLNENEEVVFQNDNVILNKVLKNEVSNTMRYLLEESLSKYGEMSFVEGYRIGGKTGTAQKYGEDGKIAQGKYVSSFFGFLNGKDASKYALILCVDEPSTGAYYGSVVAKPYAKNIFEKIIEYKNIEKDDKNVQVKKVSMPNLVGKSLVDACKILNELNIDYEIDGENGLVLSQFPTAKVEIDCSATVLVKT